MKTVYKYDVMFEDNFVLKLPLGSQILCVQTQRGNPKLWCLVDPEEKIMQNRFFRLAGTGHSITKENIRYIGSFQLSEGMLIFHLFEILE